jgi:tetrathionate reductase subunit B
MRKRDEPIGAGDMEPAEAAASEGTTPVEVEPEPELEPTVEAEPEPEPEPQPVAAEPEPPVEAEPELQPVAARDPGHQADLPAGPPAFVPLSEIAPAMATGSMTRRRFLGFGAALGGGVAGAGFLARLFPVFADSESAPPPIIPEYDPASKAWTFVIDTASCIGCGLCVEACQEENHVTEEAKYTRTWIERHTITTDGTRYVDSPEGGIHGFPAVAPAVEAEGKTVAQTYFEPRLCMQCDNSPCTVVCPVGATYRTEDGVILVDPRRCIGCGYCVVACPYGARYLAPAAERAPMDTPGIADKCTWCYHRISRGRLPACVEVCPVGARKFGDASDPYSEIATLVRDEQPKMLYPEFGTQPRVLYLGPSVSEA